MALSLRTLAASFPSQVQLPGHYLLRKPESTYQLEPGQSGARTGSHDAPVVGLSTVGGVEGWVAGRRGAPGREEATEQLAVKAIQQVLSWLERDVEFWPRMNMTERMSEQGS